jgi:hypothetical protein
VENEAMDLRFTHAREFSLGDKAIRKRLRLDLLDRQPFAVIGDLDDDVAAFVDRRSD